MKHGCHADLEEGQKPDGCVIDTNERSLCVYACKGIKKEDCEYWRPIEEVDTIADDFFMTKSEILDDIALDSYESQFGEKVISIKNIRHLCEYVDFLEANQNTKK